MMDKFCIIFFIGFFVMVDIEFKIIFIGEIKEVSMVREKLIS